MSIKNPHIALSLSVITLVIFAVFSSLVARGVMSPFNESARVFFDSAESPILSQIFLYVDFFTTPKFVVLAFFVVMIFFLGRYMHREACFFALALVLAFLAVFVFKNIFGILRPEGALVSAFSNYAFPSGHSAVSTVFLFLFGFFSFPKLDGRIREEILFTSVFLIVLIGFSRVYLGVHWASDVFGGLLLGLLVSFLVIWIFDTTSQMDFFGYNTARLKSKK